MGIEGNTQKGGSAKESIMCNMLNQQSLILTLGGSREQTVNQPNRRPADQITGISKISN